MAKQRIDNVYIAEGLADDFEELVLKCSQVSKLSFEKFSNIWKEMDFSCIFHGRPSGSELAEFCEEALHIAKFFMVSNVDNNFEKSVAGLFLVYGILNLQPYSRLAALRLVQDDVHAIKRLENVARKERRHDILYILGEVLVRGPCQYHVSARERGLDYCLRKYFDGSSSHSMLGKKPTGVFHRHNEELDIIRELSYLEDRYEKAKRQTTGTSEPDRSLSYANSRLAKELQTSLKAVVSGIVVQDANNRCDDARRAPPDRLDSVQAVKNKAMKNVVNPMKHLTGIEDRNNKPEASPSNLKTKRSNKKVVGDIHRTTSDSPESPLKSPKPYPWSLKLFNEFDEEGASTSKHKPYNNVLRTSPRVKKLSTSEATQPAQNLPMMLIDMEPITNKNENEANQLNAAESSTRRSPRKIATPRQTRIDRMISFDDSPNQQPPALTLTPKCKPQKPDTNPIKLNITNPESQFVELRLDEIPIDFSSENNNVEIEIIDLYNGKEPETITFDYSKVKEIKTYKNSKKKQNQVIKIEQSTSKPYETSCEVKSKESSSKLNSNVNQSEAISDETSTKKTSQKRIASKLDESSPKVNSNANQSEVSISNEPSTSKTTQKGIAVKSNESSPRRKQVKVDEPSPKIKQIKSNESSSKIKQIKSNEPSPKIKQVKSNESSSKIKQVKSNESSSKVISNANQSEVMINIEPSTRKTPLKRMAVKSNESSPRRKQVKTNESSPKLNSKMNQNKVIKNEPSTSKVTQKNN